MTESASPRLHLLVLASRFALEHPYAATFAAGTGVGSFVTYKILTAKPSSTVEGDVVSPKVYEVEVSPEALREMLKDPSIKLRWDLPKAALILASEQREQLGPPDIEYSS